MQLSRRFPAPRRDQANVTQQVFTLTASISRTPVVSSLAGISSRAPVPVFGVRPRSRQPHEALTQTSNFSPDQTMSTSSQRLLIEERESERRSFAEDFRRPWRRQHARKIRSQNHSSIFSLFDVKEASTASPFTRSPRFGAREHVVQQRRTCAARPGAGRGTRRKGFVRLDVVTFPGISDQLGKRTAFAARVSWKRGALASPPEFCADRGSAMLRLRHRLHIAFEATSTSGTKDVRASRAPLLSSTVTAVPEVTGAATPSTEIVTASG